MLNLAQLVAPQFIGTTAVPFYTATVTTRIDKLTVTNTSGGAVTVTIYVGPINTSFGPSNVITSVHSIAANATFNCPDLSGHVLPSGYSLNALASTASVLVLMASGVQQS